jgi:hypothetical protein
MTLAGVIDEASTELAAVESVVDSARHVLDVAAEVERRGSRIPSRLRTVAVVVAVGAVVLGGAYAVTVLLARRRTGAPEAAGPLVDDAFPDDID